MSILDRFRGGTVAEMIDEAAATAPIVELDETTAVAYEQIALLQEAIAELEADNRGWLRIDGTGRAQNFTRAGLNEAAAAARLMWIANPLIKRAVNVRTFYCWGQGVEVTGRDDTVNDVVQAFLDDPGNQAALFGHQVREETDRVLQLDGNLMFALFTGPRSGAVQIRPLPWGEVTDILSNPEDSTQRWYYLREWSEKTLIPLTGRVEQVRRRALYPDLRYRPTVRPADIGGIEVRWDSPVKHVKTGGLPGMQFGVSEVYAALPWARAYKGFLEDWASIAKALSKFAWKGTARTGRVAALRQAVERTGQQPGTGAQSLISADGAADLTPISKSGAQLDADSGRPLAMMVGAAMDLPYTILMGDPDVGNLATAKSLDRPTELAMQSRRELWAEVLRDLCGYAIEQSVRAPAGKLRGTIVRDEFEREQVVLAGDVARDIEVSWPSILEHDLAALVSAIVEADSTGRVPPEVICRLLLQALGVEDVDDLMNDLLDDDGNFIDPALAARMNAGQAAADAFRRGEDPVAAVA